jgi:lipoprotein-anchoring transpeptidase ErfK/SrfK
MGGHRSALVRVALALAILVLLAAGGLAAAIHWWSGATLAADPTALARLELQPLAGKLVSARAFTAAGVEFPVSVSDGRLVPGTAVPAGLDVRVRVVVRRPGWLAHVLGEHRVEELSVQTPVGTPAGRYVTVARGAPLRVRFTTPVDRVRVGGRTIPVGGSRVVSLGARSAAGGTVAVAVAARPWEQLGEPMRLTWFRASSKPPVLVSPKPGAAISPGAPLRLVFAQPVSQVLGTKEPRVSGGVAGRWSSLDAHTILFRPASFGYPFGSTVRVKLGTATSAGRTLSWTVPAASVLRLHQLLAGQGYLPVDWHPAADPAASRRAELAAAVRPPAGTFGWRFPNSPPQLTRQWSPTKITEITRGAVMMFEHDHGLTVDGFAGPHVWRTLIADALAGKRRTDGYSYVYVHTHLPQLLTLWHNGRVVLTSPGNTGIPATPTTPGTYPVFEHIPVGEMSGTNPDGSHYDDTGIRWISYFHGGEALHAFTRASFGTPQSLGCVELPLESAAKVWPYTPIGTLVTIEN